MLNYRPNITKNSPDNDINVQSPERKRARRGAAPSTMALHPKLETSEDNSLAIGADIKESKKKGTAFQGDGGISLIGQTRLDILTPNISKSIDSGPAVEAHLEFMQTDKNQEHSQKMKDPSPTDCFDSLRPVH